MVGKIIFLALVGLVLVYGSPAPTTLEEYQIRYDACGQEKDVAAARLCIEKMLDILNDKGEFNVQNLEDYLKSVFNDPDNQGSIIDVYKKCAEKAIGDDAAAKSISLTTCVEKMRQMMIRPIF